VSISFFETRQTCCFNSFKKIATFDSIKNYRISRSRIRSHYHFMKYTTLPDTDIKVSKICLGSMTWGEQNTEAEGHEQLDYAIDQGVNFIDTAEMYSVPGKKETQGSTERIIGKWFGTYRCYS